MENSDGTVGTTYSYNDPSLTIADGSAICFDWTLLAAPPQVITFQVTVDGDAPYGVILNEAMHNNNAMGTVEEVAEAAFTVPMPPKINEFSFNTGGTDVEYIELIGTPNTDYSDYVVLEIESDKGEYAGEIDGFSTPGVYAMGTTDENGLFLAELEPNDIENSSITLLLVKNFTGSDGDDLDTDNDGVLDVTPWEEVADSIAVDDYIDDGYAYYGAPKLYAYYDGLNYAPGGASRIPDGVDTDTIDDWVRNDYDLAGIPGETGSIGFGEAYNTPGEFNMVYMGEFYLPLIMR